MWAVPRLRAQCAEPGVQARAVPQDQESLLDNVCRCCRRAPALPRPPPASRARMRAQLGWLVVDPPLRHGDEQTVWEFLGSAANAFRSEVRPQRSGK